MVHQKRSNKKIWSKPRDGIGFTKQGPTEKRIFLWLLINNVVLTANNLARWDVNVRDNSLAYNSGLRWGVFASNTCHMCDSFPKSVQHLFFTCQLVVEVFHTVQRVTPLNTHDLKIKVGGDRLYFFIYQEIWKEQNNRIFRGERRDPSYITETIIIEFHLYKKAACIMPGGHPQYEPFSTNKYENTMA